MCTYCCQSRSKYNYMEGNTSKYYNDPNWSRFRWTLDLSVDVLSVLLAKNFPPCHCKRVGERITEHIHIRSSLHDENFEWESNTTVTTFVNCCVFGKNLSGFSRSLGGYAPSFDDSFRYIGFGFLISFTLAANTCTGECRLPIKTVLCLTNGDE